MNTLFKELNNISETKTYLLSMMDLSLILPSLEMLLSST
jgi:hypothetical protein